MTDLNELWSTFYDDPTLFLIDPLQEKSYRQGNKPPSPEPLTTTLYPLQFNLVLDGYKPLPKDKPLYPPSSQLVDIKRYDKLQQLKTTYSVDVFTKLRDRLNPFENIGNSEFMNRAAVKLANIDLALTIMPNEGGFNFPKTDRAVVFCDLGSAPGGFAQYIQYRVPNNYGYGMTLSAKGGAPKALWWKHELLNAQRFKMIDGPVGDGNIITQGQWLADVITGKIMEDSVPVPPNVSPQKLNDYGLGVDLVVADASIDPTGQELHQEVLNCPLLVAESLIALQILWPDGDFIMKTFDTVTDATADLIALLSQHFKQIYLFKPISSRPANSEQYLVCKGFIKGQEVHRTVQIFQQANSAHQNGQRVQRFLDNRPVDFDQKLKLNNDQSVDRQWAAGKLIVNGIQAHFNKKPLPDIPDYDLYYCTVYWNIPSQNPLPIKVLNGGRKVLARKR